MSTYALAVFLLLFAIMNLLETKIPGWVLGLAALLAAVALVISAAPWKRGQ